MSIHDNLLHRRRRQCAEQRHYLAELELLAQRLRADAGRLRAEIERAVALGDPLSTRPLIERHGAVERSVAAIESQIAAAGDALAAAEQELTRHELAAVRRAGREGLAERRRPRYSRRAPPAAPPAADPESGR